MEKEEIEKLVAFHIKKDISRSNAVQKAVREYISLDDTTKEFCAKKKKTHEEVVKTAVTEYLANDGINLAQKVVDFFRDNERRKKNGQGKI